jgi:beta-phosphoglucomutase
MTLGFLFDLDGTLADTDPVHFRAFNTLLREFGRSLTHEHYTSSVLGGANALIMQRLFPEFDRARHAELADRKEVLFRSHSGHLEPLEGLRDLLDEAALHDVKVGVVTNAPRANAEHMLDVLGLQHLLPTVVVGEEIARSKPDPLPYLTGLSRLPCPADRAIAFEDSIAGVTAASAAGIYTVAIKTSLDADALLAAGADMAIDDYRDPTLLALVRAAVAGGPIRRLNAPA